MRRTLLQIVLASPIFVLSRNSFGLTPPMGFMTWQLFRCGGRNGPNDDCTDPNITYCISDALLRGQAQAMADKGFTAAGYTIVSQDDCYVDGRDPVTNRLRANNNFPGNSLASTASYIHNLGMKLGAYTAEARTTCCGLMGSQGYEELDAQTFANWGVDYLKVDGCQGTNETYYGYGYPLMGASLEGTGRLIGYSCSWPDYW